MNTVFKNVNDFHKSGKKTRSQTCVKYRGLIICIKRNTDVNTGDLKVLHKKISK